ncbi:hypothetical protein SFR_4693 [Streptomyces sp. FR-008]|nr:hypothetical protein SFR_4693 [Streptomyces sp. FR-008]
MYVYGVKHGVFLQERTGPVRPPRSPPTLKAPPVSAQWQKRHLPTGKCQRVKAGRPGAYRCRPCP